MWQDNRDPLYPLQQEGWKWYKNEIKTLGNIDICIANGDLIDGRQEKDGSTGLLAVDRLEQANMATYCLRETKAKQFFISYGTPYHTGSYEDFENVVARNLAGSGLKVEIGGHLFIDINGVVLDVKHKTGSSSVPHGRHTPVAREKLWNKLWALKNEQPDSNIVIRSHTHFFGYCGDDTYLAFTTPALEGLGSRYGSRACTGLVDFGFVHINIDRKGQYTWQVHKAKLKAQKAQVLKV